MERKRGFILKKGEGAEGKWKGRGVYLKGKGEGYSSGERREREEDSLKGKDGDLGQGWENVWIKANLPSRYYIFSGNTNYIWIKKLMQKLKN